MTWNDGRYAEAKRERFDDLAVEMVRLNPGVIYVSAAQVQAQTSTTERATLSANDWAVPFSAPNSFIYCTPFTGWPSSVK
jgi:hypothetical protein